MGSNNNKEKHGKKNDREFVNQFGNMGFRNEFANLYDWKFDFSEAVQAKLEISSPGDIHEQQADNIARKVVSGEHAGMEVSSSANTVMAKGEGSGLCVNEELDKKLSSSKGRGEMLDESIRSEMEDQMDADLSDVRIHTDNEASKMSESINAKAFTHGQDIYFKEREYGPGTVEGKELLAHELVHTQQQKGAVNRKVQRAMKFEFQTGNYIWKVKKDGSKMAPLPRKYGPNGVTEEDGSQPIHLATGENGKPATSKADIGDFIPYDKGPLSTIEAIADNYSMVEDKKANPALPAQFEISIKVKDLDKYLQSGDVPNENDIEIISKEDKAKNPQVFPKGSYNRFTYEFIYYDAGQYIENDKPVIGPVYINMPSDVHRDKEGRFKPGKIKYMKKKVKGNAASRIDADKEAQYVREYIFTQPVSVESVLNKKAGTGNDSAGPLTLVNETDNSQVPEMDGAYNPNTFEIIYLNFDKTPLDIHLDAEGKFQKGTVKLMKVGRESTKNKRPQFSQEITVHGVQGEDQLVGKTESELQAKISGFKIIPGEMTENKKGDILPGTYEFIYITDTGSLLNVYRDPKGKFMPGDEFLMQKATKPVEGEEQTAMELQSENHGFVEFETPKWFRKWSDLNLRIEDAVKMTQKMSGAPLLAPDDPVRSNIEAVITSLIAKKERSPGETLGKLHEWPFPIDGIKLDADEKLIVEIRDMNWGAKIQVSEEIRLSQYQSLLEQHEKPDIVSKTLDNSAKLLSAALEISKNESVKKIYPSLNNIAESDLENLKGLLQVIANYLISAYTYNLKGSASKYGFSLMSRTSFYSMYKDILDDKEKILFKQLVIKNKFIQVMKNDLTTLAKSHYKAKDLDDYKKKAGKDYINITRDSPVFIFGYGSESHNTGPTINEWLISIYAGGGYDPKDKKRKTDKLSPLTGGSASMGRFDVEDEAGKKDTGLVKFETRGSVAMGGNERNAADWVSYARDIFKEAVKRRNRPDIADDPSTPEVNESDSTGLIYDGD